MKPFLTKKKRVGKPAAPATNFCSADQWLEHLEEEIEPKCMAEQKNELDLVLENSAEDAALRESLVRVRAAVKTLDDVALPESGHYYDDLHTKIMAAIDTEVAMNGEPDRSRPLKPERGFALSFFAARSSLASGALGMTMMIAILAFVGLHRAPVSGSASAFGSMAASGSASASASDENFERKIAAVDSAEFAHEMGSFESEEDFLTESAAQRLKQLSSAQAEALIRSLKR